MLFKLFRALWLGVLTAACVLFILIRSETANPAPAPILPVWAAEGENRVVPVVRVEVPALTPKPSGAPLPLPNP
ncbi:MAG: hypothetical protein FWF10_03275 [Clostridiales bacterium]|nr:hypothetical protein [Clostridiales bacterium]